MMRSFWPASLLFSVFLFASLPCFSDEIQDIGRLLKSGQQAQALERVNRYLAGKPRDAQGRFLKGLILTEQNKMSEAIDVFTRLSQDFPELPEPYNNLAVLFAAQGQYEKARQALEMSIRTHPSYATAYENLGDVYTKLASQAYDRALQLDASNTAAQSKLSLIRELISTNTRSPGPAAPGSSRSEPRRVAEAPKQVAPIAPKPPGPEARAPAEAKPRTAEPAGKSGADEVLSVVQNWARAWAAKDVGAYLSFYAKDFKTPNGEPRSNWETSRRQRITAPKHIEVTIESPKVTLTGDSSATVSFRQHYRSDHLKANSSKTLAMVRVDGKWLIQQERVGN